MKSFNLGHNNIGAQGAKHLSEALTTTRYVVLIAVLVSMYHNLAQKLTRDVPLNCANLTDFSAPR